MNLSFLVTLTSFFEHGVLKKQQTRKPRVLQVLYSGLGGHGSVAFSILEEGNAQRWQPLFAFLGVEPLLSDYRGYCEARAIPHKYFGVSSGRPFFAWTKLLAWLFKSKPDVILLHSVKAILPCLVYSRLSGKSVVFIEHQANALKKPSEWWISRLGMLFSNKVVYLTENYANEVRARIGRIYSPDKVTVIPNGINTRKFHPAKGPLLKGDTVHLGMAARFTSMRCQDVLVKAIEKLDQLLPHLNWHLTLAGDGETHAAIESLIQSKGLQEKVSLPGHLGEEDLIAWFHELDLYVHASEGETLSTSMLQAMACGLPIVASDVPGIRNLISDDDRFGCLVGRQSADCFAEMIAGLVADKEHTRSMGTVANKLAEERYSCTRMSREYAALVERLCG